jgi:hypothetical protein
VTGDSPGDRRNLVTHGVPHGSTQKELNALTKDANRHLPSAPFFTSNTLAMPAEHVRALGGLGASRFRAAAEEAAGRSNEPAI